MMPDPSVPSNQLMPQFNPDSPYLIGLEKLLHAAYADLDLTPLGGALIAHLQEPSPHPNLHNAMMDLSSILYIRGDHEIAAATQLDAIRAQPLYHLPTAQGREVRLRLLALAVPGDFMANIPLEFLLSRSDIALDVLYIEPDGDLPQLLPPHDVLFVAIGESDETRDLLARLSGQLSYYTKPLLNLPVYSLDLSRDSVGELLQNQPKIAIPLTARVDRDELTSLADGRPVTDFLADGSFPLIVRPLGSHAGHGLEKMQTHQDLAAYLATHDNDVFFISNFVDYCSDDGYFRKYRIVFVDGEPHLCHMGISQHWMIHYLNAGMSESQAKRDEEAVVMRSFAQDFAVRHRQAFETLCQTFPLDYFGIDCGEARDGRLLIFEVDTGMIVHAMDPVDMFPYKQENMLRVFAAFQAMLFKAAGQDVDR